MISKYFHTLILLFVGIFSFAQQIEWGTSYSIGGNENDQANCIAVDHNENIFIGGSFKDTANFGSDSSFLYTTSTEDGFLAKYSNSMECLWVTIIHSFEQGGAVIQGLDVGPDNSVYVLGKLYFTTTFGLGGNNQVVIDPSFTFAIFIAKYDQEGNLLWVKEVITEDWPNGGRDLSVDEEGNCFISGEFDNLAIFGPGEPNETTLTGSNTSVFFAKFKPNGSLAWAKGVEGNSGNIFGLGIAVDNEGNSIATGKFPGSITFGKGEFYETKLEGTPWGDDCIFITKFNPNGQVIWAKEAGKTNDRIHWSWDVEIDHEGNSYITGFYTYGAIFGMGEPNQVTLESNGSRDAFLAKFNPEGLLQWVETFGGSSSRDYGHALALGKDNHLYVTGSFYENCTFGAELPNEITFISTGVQDIFLASYTRDGEFIEAQHAGGANGYNKNDAWAIALDRIAQVFIAGHCGDTIVFGGDSLISNGKKDILLASTQKCRIDDLSILASDSILCQGESVLLETTEELSNYNWNNNASVAPSYVITKPGLYYVYGDVDSACWAYDEIRIRGSELNLVNPGPMYIYETETLDAGSGFEEYLWNDGSTSQQIEIIGEDKGPGNHLVFVQAVDQWNCVSYDSIMITVLDYMNAQSRKWQDFSILPNPANNHLQFVFPEKTRIREIQVYDVRGTLVYSNKNISKGIQSRYYLKIRTLHPGSYILRVISAESVRSQKFIKR